MFVESNGVTFHLQIDGTSVDKAREDTTPPLLLLHGFTGSTASWSHVSSPLAALFPVIRVDLIGHGKTECPADPARYSMEHAVTDLLHVLDHLGVQQFRLLGYSMGARLALHIALTAPERIERLILESGTYGIPTLALRRERAQTDGRLADWIEIYGIEAFAKRWESHPLFASQRSLPKDVLEYQRQERLRQTPRGLANSLRGMGTGAQRCLRESLSMLAMPTLLICGALDTKFTNLAREMHTLIPHSELVVIPGAGHNVHLECPELFADHVRRFLQQANPPAAWNKDDIK